MNQGNMLWRSKERLDPENDVNEDSSLELKIMGIRDNKLGVRKELDAISAALFKLRSFDAKTNPK